MSKDGMDGLRRLRADMAKQAGGPAGSSAAEPSSRRRGRRGRHSNRRRPLRRWPRRILILANVMVALILVGAASAFGYVHWRLSQIKKVAVPGLVATGSSPQSHSDGTPIPPFTMLVIGSDTRDLTGSNNAQFGNEAETGGQRSDSILLVRVVPKTRSLALFSIPRDTIVPVPGYGTTRINAAFNSGNPALLVQVLKQDFNIDVNHVAEFNFDTFEAVANAIGGVYQWFPTPARDLFSNLGVSAGCQLLTGAQALAFARSREYEYKLDGSWHYQVSPESDLARIQRQQDFVKLAVKKAESVAPTNPITLNSLIVGLTKNVTLDSGFSDSLIFSLAEDFHSAGLTNVPSFTYPTFNSTEVSGALDPDTAAGTAMIQQWLATGEAPAAAPKATSSTAPPTTTVSPSSVSIEVANGSGISGQATAAASDLTSLGYSPFISGLADYGHATNVINYAPDSLAAAQQLQSQLVNGATLVEDSALAEGSYNVQLLTGQDFDGVKGGTAATTTTSSPTTLAPSSATSTAAPANGTTAVVEPDAATFYKGQYIPPGRVQGQIPQTCPS